MSEDFVVGVLIAVAVVVASTIVFLVQHNRQRASKAPVVVSALAAPAMTPAQPAQPMLPTSAPSLASVPTTSTSASATSVTSLLSRATSASSTAAPLAATTFAKGSFNTRLQVRQHVNAYNIIITKKHIPFIHNLENIKVTIAVDCSDDDNARRLCGC